MPCRRSDASLQPRPARWTSLFFICLLALAGGLAVTDLTACDVGSSPDSTSEFPQEDPFDREIEGHALRGPEPVAGATVYLEPVSGFKHDDGIRDAEADASGFPGVFTSTDLGGRFDVQSGPFFYDLTVRKDRDVAVFRRLGQRFFDPQLGADGPLTGFTTSITATTSPAPIEGHSVAYFISGTDAKALSGGDTGALVATFDKFTSTITIVAAEYVTAEGLLAVTRSGSASVTVTNGIATTAVISTLLLGSSADAGSVSSVTFEATPPPGFTLASLDIVLDTGVRRNGRTVAHIQPGTPVPISIFGPGTTRYFVHAVATSGGAVSDSGLFGFAANSTVPIVVPLPAPTADLSFDGPRSFEAGANEIATDAGVYHGVFEHVLVPQDPNGTSIRVITTDRLAVIPDVTSLGVTQPLGAYTWTFTLWPTLTEVVGLGGPDVRAVTPFASNPPQTIVLQ